MLRLGMMLVEHREAILDRWVWEAQHSEAAQGLTRPEVENVMGTLVLVLLGGVAPGGRGLGELVEQHVSVRLRQGFKLHEILDEFVMLGRAVLGIAHGLPASAQPGIDDVASLHADLQGATARAVQIFTRHLVDEEQLEKRVLRRTFAVVDECARGANQLEELAARLCRVIGESFACRTSGLVLEGTDDDERFIVLRWDGAVERIGARAAPFLATVLDDPERAQAFTGPALGDVATRGALCIEGCRLLVGVAVSTRVDGDGVLYVADRERPSFGAGELRRLEALGERLGRIVDTWRTERDLTERVVMLERIHANEQRLMSTVAHDLRGPLMAARVSTELVAKRLIEVPQCSPVLGDHCQRIERCLDRADRMLRDLLDVFRLRAGETLPLHLEPCDLAAIARDVVDEVLLQHPGSVTLAAPVVVAGVWSAEDLRRCVWNLTTNAVKFRAAGTVVGIVMRATSEWAELRISNLGLPIPAAAIPRLFEPYSRVAPAAGSDGPRGWGLGLAVVHGSVRSHGGTIDVTSSAGEGTTFTVRLPRDARSALRVSAPSPELAATQ